VYGNGEKYSPVSEEEEKEFESTQNHIPRFQFESNPPLETPEDSVQEEEDEPGEFLI
jgi:hypothetical protein